MLHYPRTELLILSLSAEYWQMQLWSSNWSKSGTCIVNSNVSESVRRSIAVLDCCSIHSAVLQVC